MKFTYITFGRRSYPERLEEVQEDFISNPDTGSLGPGLEIPSA